MCLTVSRTKREKLLVLLRERYNINLKNRRKNMASKPKPLIINGHININLGALKLLEYLHINGTQEFYYELKYYGFSIRHFCEESKEHLTKYLKADEDLIEQLQKKLPTVGLHLEMTREETKQYMKSGSIPQEKPKEEVLHDSVKPSEEEKMAPKAVHQTKPIVQNVPSFSPSSRTQNSEERQDAKVKVKAEKTKATKTKAAAKPKGSSGGGSSYQKPYGKTEDTRRNLMFFRVSDEEKAGIQAAADACDMNISTYCRALVLGKSPRAAMTDEERKLFMENREILAHLRQMRNYFNKDRHDPKVWEELSLVVRVMSQTIQNMKS